MRRFKFFQFPMELMHFNFMHRVDGMALYKKSSDYRTTEISDNEPIGLGIGKEHMMKRLITWIFPEEQSFFSFMKKADGMDLYRSIERIS